jgi:TetR/AcrR family transcriptional repressor of nem operon
MSSPAALPKPPPADRGRPRKFDEDAVLTTAARVFWEKGYHAASIDDLCEATGVLRGSLYGAFGDKRGLLLAALARYGEGRIARLAQSLQSPAPERETIRQALLYYTRTASDLNGPRACFITNTALELLPQEREVGALIQQIFRRMSGLLAAAVTRAQAAGIFAPGLDEAAVGLYLLSSIQGLRILGKVYTEADLTRVVDLILRALE